jgi:hypothetical protein
MSLRVHSNPSRVSLMLSESNIYIKKKKKRMKTILMEKQLEKERRMEATE